MPVGSPLIPRAKGRLLRELLRRGATATQLASKTGLDVTVVRRHMRELVAAGTVQEREVPGRRGRPRITYEATVAGRELFFTRYDVVLESVADSLRARLGDPSAVRVFNDAARRLATQLGGSRTEGAAVALFQELGFEPELRGNGGPHQMLSHNCPIIKVAREHPELTCDAFHCTLLGELLGTAPPPLRQAISRGADYCVHDLGPPAKGRTR